MNADTSVKIKNRSKGITVYALPELGITKREIMPGEVRTVKFQELEALSFIPGGRELLEQDLQISDKEVIEALGLTVEQEYFMNELEVKDLMNNGSIDAFLDCLDFAPEGVIDLIKSYSVTMPLNDSKKREIMLEHPRTKFNVTNAIMFNKMSQEKEGTNEEKGRRVQIKQEEEKSQGNERRTVQNIDSNKALEEIDVEKLPKYNVVSQ